MLFIAKTFSRPTDLAEPFWGFRPLYPKVPPLMSEGSARTGHITFYNNFLYLTMSHQVISCIDSKWLSKPNHVISTYYTLAQQESWLVKHTMNQWILPKVCKSLWKSSTLTYHECMMWCLYIYISKYSFPFYRKYI